MGDRVLITNMLSQWLRDDTAQELHETAKGSLYAFLERERKWLVSLDQDVGEQPHSSGKPGEKEIR